MATFTMSIISINNAEHYTWGEGCDGWHLLKRDDRIGIIGANGSGKTTLLQTAVTALALTLSPDRKSVV